MPDIDVGFRSIINQWFIESKIMMLVIDISVYYTPEMKKNPLLHLKQGFREIDIIHKTLGYYDTETEELRVSRDEILTFDDSQPTDYYKDKILISNHSNLEAVMFIWEIANKDDRKFYTYKSISEANKNTLLRIK